MNIVVAGGGGFLGRNLVAELLRHKHQVTVIDLPVVQATLTQSNCTFIGHDLSQSTDFVFNGKYDAAVFLAQSPFYHQLPEKAPHVFAVNVGGLTAFLEASRQCGVRHFLYASSGSIYKQSFLSLNEESAVEPTNLYALSKVVGENVLKFYENYFEISILRFFAIYGPHQSKMMIPNLINKIKTGEPVFLEKASFEEGGNGGFRTTPTYVSDVAHIIMRMIEDSISGTFNIAGSEVLSFKQMAEIIGSEIGIEPIFNFSPKIRNSDLIADNSKMLGFYRQALTDFITGIKSMIHFNV